MSRNGPRCRGNNNVVQGYRMSDPRLGPARPHFQTGGFLACIHDWWYLLGARMGLLQPTLSAAWDGLFIGASARRPVSVLRGSDTLTAFSCLVQIFLLLLILCGIRIEFSVSPFLYPASLCPDIQDAGSCYLGLRSSRRILECTIHTKT